MKTKTLYALAPALLLMAALFIYPLKAQTPVAGTTKTFVTTTSTGSVNVPLMILRGTSTTAGHSIFEVRTSTNGFAFAIRSNGVVVGSVAPDSVDTSKLTTDAVDSSKIMNTAVQTNKINTDAVTTPKIINAGVETAKLAADSVTTAKIINSGVDTPKLAADSVTTAKIINAGIDTPKLATDSITGAKVLNGTLTSSKMTGTSITCTGSQYSAAPVFTNGVLTSGGACTAAPGATQWTTNGSNVNFTGGNVAAGNANATADARALQASDYILVGNGTGGAANRSNLRFTGAGLSNTPSAANAESDGDKLVFYNDTGSKYAIGMGATSLWFQVNGQASDTFQFWIGAGTTADIPVFKMAADGVVTSTNNFIIGGSANGIGNALTVTGSTVVIRNNGYSDFGGGSLSVVLGVTGTGKISKSGDVALDVVGAVKVTGTNSPTTGGALCLTAAGRMSKCSGLVDASGNCTCPEP